MLDTTKYLLQVNNLITRVKIHEVILGEDDEQIIQADDKDKLYYTSSAKTEALNPSKLTQRMVCAKRMRKDGVTLELFGGRGMLTKAVYSRFASKHYLVEEDIEEVEEARKISNTAVFHSNNLDWCNTKLGEIGRLDLVDFDAFGTIVPAVRAFFANYKVTAPLIVTVTDGYATHIHFKFRDPRALADDLLQHGYPVIPKSGMNASVFFSHVLRVLFEHIGKTDNFTVEQINTTTGKGANSGPIRTAGKNTVYSGFMLRPSKPLSVNDDDD